MLKGKCWCLYTCLKQLHILIAYNTNPVDVMKKVILETSDTLTLQLSWRMETGTLYNVAIVPEATMTYLTGNATIQLPLSYNIEYTLSIVATVCEQNNYTTTIRLNYGEIKIKPKSCCY